ncbi:glycosyltransferase family 9 protein [Pedosphaera parvula]|uniref:Glycosyl transferase family 9 n=1 Tax=Pedosphaera parvula (strain Ellin514) TaxID=320771 RepID=B9XII7_PEDPL|nr:glycosyltransferase family 9 protein [Pedosphaera parvula]EEF60448.1 glycosyl transferase family 9 [Pedosphaera parvula Ellin514]
MARSQGKILVIRGGAIGDFILTLPVLAALKQQFPAVHLEVLGYPNVAQLATYGNLVANVKAIEGRDLASFFARDGVLPTELIGYFGQFDIIISYLYDPDQIFETNVGRCSGAQFIAGPHRPDETQSLHATEVFLKPLERLAIFEADTVPRLEVSKAFETSTTTGRWLALHPGSGSDRKNWPEWKWVELIHHLVKSTHLNLMIVGGEAERERLPRLAQPVPATRLKLLQSVALPELAQWLASASGFVGHDSGISHLAAAVGVPSVILWGDTAEAVWSPRSKQITILRDQHGLKGLSLEVVINQVEQLLKKG